MLEFIEAHRTELVLFAGDPINIGHGFLTKRELSVAVKANCTTAILIPAKAGSENGPHRPKGT